MRLPDAFLRPWPRLDVPTQDPFDEGDIRGMSITFSRRQLSTEWQDIIRKPDSRDRDWCLMLPFANTYCNAFESMCSIRAYPHVTANGKLQLFLKGIDWSAGPPQEVHEELLRTAAERSRRSENLWSGLREDLSERRQCERDDSWRLTNLHLT